MAVPRAYSGMGGPSPLEIQILNGEAAYQQPSPYDPAPVPAGMPPWMVNQTGEHERLMGLIGAAKTPEEKRMYVDQLRASQRAKEDRAMHVFGSQKVRKLARKRLSEMSWLALLPSSAERYWLA